MFGQRKRRQRDSTAYPATVYLSLVCLTRKTALVFFLTGLIGGCNSSMTKKTEPFQHRTIKEFSCRAYLDGFEIAVEPYSDQELVRRHFGTDLLSLKIIPIEVLFINRQASGGFLLQPESVVLTNDRGVEILELNLSNAGIPRSDTGPIIITSAMLWLTVSQLLGLTVLHGVEEHSRLVEDICRNMESLQFLDRPLYPSDSNRGFIYLKCLDMTDFHKADAIKFRLKNVQSRQEKMIVVPMKRK